MKKALVVFLILAVAGGLFAQITFSGNVSTGIGIGISDQEGVDPKVDYVRTRDGAAGLRGQIAVSYTGTSDDFGKWGLGTGFRYQQTSLFASGANEFQSTGRNLWWQPNSFVYINLGTGDPGGYGTPGGIGESNGVRGGDAGLKVELTPIAGLSIGAHLSYGNSELLLENISPRFGVKYTVPSLLTVVGNVRLYPEEKDYTKFTYAAGVSYLGLAGVGISTVGIDGALYDSGKDKSFFGAGLRVGYALGALSADARGRVYLANGSALSKDFMPMLFRGEINYTINSTVSAGVEAQYALGRKPASTWDFAYNVGGVGSADYFVKDNKNSYFAVSPRVTFKVGPEIMLGWDMIMDTSDGAAVSANSWKTRNLIYGTIGVSF